VGGADFEALRRGLFTREELDEADAEKQREDAVAPLRDDAQLEEPRADGTFHNPYSFVPSPPRRHDGHALGDARPAGHARYEPALLSGRVAFMMTVQSPLLLPDPARAEWRPLGRGQHHRTFVTRRDARGRPLLAPTAVRGMLRAAFEAITNSRFGVFDDPTLAWRATTDDVRRAALVPVRVVGRQVLEMEQARLPAYAAPVTYSRGGVPQTGDRVVAVVDQRTPPVVTAIELARDRHLLPIGGRRVTGWVLRTGKPPRLAKEHERVFFGRGRKLPIGPGGFEGLAEGWRRLIEDYARQAEGPQAIKIPGAKHQNAGHAELVDGTLAWAVCENGQVQALVPVTVGRRLYPITARQLAAASNLLPAEDLDELSPAERVFGWVKRGRGGRNQVAAYRGQLRVGPVECLTDASKAIEAVADDGLPLAVLSSPKPSYARFYAAKSPQGERLPDGTPKRDGFKPGRGLRGRKVYPHQRRDPATYWYQQDPSPEFRRHGGTRDGQNVSLRDWVAPGTAFRVELEVMNLSRVEAGALLYLLTLGNGAHLRLGAARPLGFGSVRLELDADATALQIGETIAAAYRPLSDRSKGSTEPLDELVEEFRACAHQRVLAAFERASHGFEDDKPIRYPRRQGQEEPSYAWFVANERIGARDNNRSLPDLTQDEGLPEL